MESKMTTPPDLPETDQPSLMNVGPADPLAFATLVSVDGRRVRLARDSGCAVISIEGRQPVTLDKFQTAAFRLAVASLGDVA
jgi:hypothetical protein